MIVWLISVKILGMMLWIVVSLLFGVILNRMVNCLCKMFSSVNKFSMMNGFSNVFSMINGFSNVFYMMYFMVSKRGNRDDLMVIRLEISAMVYLVWLMWYIMYHLMKRQGLILSVVMLDSVLGF